MPFVFACPHCGAETQVDNAYLGQSGPCYVCGKQVTLPNSFEDLQAAQRPEDSGKTNTKIGVAAGVLLLAIVAVAASIGILVLLARPAFESIGGSAGPVRCRTNLARIALAMQSYHDDYQCYPPAIVIDRTGRPIHSWRVLLLPYLGYKGLHQRYDFDQPWNSAANLELVSDIPSVFVCPDDADARKRGETSYMVIRSAAGLFPGKKTVSKSEIIDGTANTLLVVEAAGEGAAWTEPRDLRIEGMRFIVNGEGGGEIHSHHSRGASVVMADSTTYFISDKTPRAVIQALITKNGGEPITSRDLKR